MQIDNGDGGQSAMTQLSDAYGVFFVSLRVSNERIFAQVSDGEDVWTGDTHAVDADPFRLEKRSAEEFCKKTLDIFASATRSSKTAPESDLYAVNCVPDKQGEHLGLEWKTFVSGWVRTGFMKLTQETTREKKSAFLTTVFRNVVRLRQSLSAMKQEKDQMERQKKEAVEETGRVAEMLKALKMPVWASFADLLNTKKSRIRELEERIQNMGVRRERVEEEDASSVELGCDSYGSGEDDDEDEDEEGEDEYENGESGDGGGVGGSSSSGRRSPRKRRRKSATESNSIKPIVKSSASTTTTTTATATVASTSGSSRSGSGSGSGSARRTVVTSSAMSVPHLKRRARQAERSVYRMETVPMDDPVLVGDDDDDDADDYDAL